MSRPCRDPFKKRRKNQFKALSKPKDYPGATNAWKKLWNSTHERLEDKHTFEEFKLQL